MNKHSLETHREPRRTKLSFDEFKAKTLNYLQAQNVTPLEPRSKSKTRNRALSSGKVVKVVTGGSRTTPSEDHEEEFQIRKIIEEMSISRVDEVSMSKEASRTLSEDEPKQDFEQPIEQLKQKEVKAVVQKTLERRQVCMQVIAQLNGDKSCSFSMSQFEQSSGSETEKPSEAADSRSALISAVNDLIRDQSQKRQFLSAISVYKTQKLSLYLNGSEVEGVYCQGPGGLHRVFSLRSSPEVVSVKSIRRCYRLQANELKSLPVTQVWSADAFSTCIMQSRPKNMIMQGRKAPAYTLGKSRRTLSLSFTDGEGPGPAYYNLETDGKTQSPRTVIGNSVRMTEPLNPDFPGPGAYEPHSHKIKVPTALILSRKPQKSRNTEFPGPADYSPHRFDTSFCYTFSGRFEEKVDDGPPGPAHYNAVVPGKASPRVTYPPNRIGRSPRETRYETIGPGPAKYVPRVQIWTKGTTFPRTNKTGKARDDKEPGPWTYNVSGSYKKGGISMSARPEISHLLNPNPGPADYQVLKNEDGIRNSFGKSLRFDSPKEIIPLPVGFVSEKLKQNRPAFSIGHGKRSSIASENQVPGPGTYAPRWNMTAPKYSVRSRYKSTLDTIPVSDKQGPGDYSPKAVLRSSPKAFIGLSSRHKYSLSMAPAPGTYDLPTVPSGPKFTFTHSTRALSQEAVPPGE